MRDDPMHHEAELGCALMVYGGALLLIVLIAVILWLIAR